MRGGCGGLNKKTKDVVSLGRGLFVKLKAGGGGAFFGNVHNSWWASSFEV